MVIYIQLKSVFNLLFVSFTALIFIGVASSAGMGNVEKVQQQYQLLLTGQIDKMLGNFTDNATWIEGTTQWGGEFHGKEQIRGFIFNRLFGLLNPKVGTGPTEFLNSSYEVNQVAVLGKTNATVKSTNKSFESDWVEIWTIGANGSIVKVENYYDASKMAEIAEAFKK